jgi:FtsP/CotA-like multicopper oxidase with cupredoxin domain
VGPGGSQEAVYDLRADVPAGMYHVACDAIIIGPVDVTFTLIWRRDQVDATLAQWIRHWDPLPNGGYDAQGYQIDEAAPAISWQAGDQLVFRYAAANTTTAEAFIPNGDGFRARGQIPNITLPR